jgi:hypothetical protein
MRRLMASEASVGLALEAVTIASYGDSSRAEAGGN